MKTTDLWSGDFGNTYHDRNRVAWKDRLPFWQSAIDYMHPSSAFEFGCGPAWNLRAIQSITPSIELSGADINAKAVEEARQAGFEVQQVHAQGIAGLYEPQSFDLTFTAGCLIHVAPADLERTMRGLIEVSGRYVLAIEYHAEREEEVDYRGQKGALWRRPYGALYQALGLALLAQGVAGGFDNCEFYLLERPQT